MTNGAAAGPTVLEWWSFFICIGAQLHNDEGYCPACEGELVARARREGSFSGIGVPRYSTLRFPNGIKFWKLGGEDQGDDDVRRRKRRGTMFVVSLF